MGFVPVWILYVGGGLVGLLGSLVLLYTSYVAYIHWKYSHLPSPRRPSYYCGHVPDIWTLRKKELPLTHVIDFWLDKVVESKTFIVFFFHTPILFTLDPSVVKEVVMNKNNGKTDFIVRSFTTTFGERFMKKGLVTIQNYDAWKPYRQLYDPAFKKSYLRTLTGTFNDMTNSTLDEMKQLADGMTVVPLKKYIMQLTLDIINKVAFNTDFSKLWTAETLGVKLPVGSELSVFSYLINTSLQGMQYSFNSVFPSLNEFLYPREAKKYKKCVQALRKIGRDCIMRRIKMIQNGEEIPKDILTLMLSSNSDSDNIEELVDNFITFYIAGQETTANTIMFCLILLALHPNTLERLQQEIKDVLGDRTTVTEKDLEELQYTEQVVHESLRLYPPFVALSRTICSTLTVGNYTIPAGTDIRMMNANMCRKSEHFDDPDTFNPDRFHPDNKKPSSFIFFPFGVGHRSCIGKHFALMESKMALARIIQTFTIRFPEDYKIKTIIRLTLQPKDDLLCTLTLN